MISTGEQIGRYKIRSAIGKGGMGEVFLAEDTELERLIALKILPEDLANDTERMRRFVQEAKSASALNHPNIITIYEIGKTDDTHFIATEYIEGETLHSRLKSETMSLKSVLDVAIQIASALDAAHRSGIVHRDIKPENIMIRPDGFVKILDFGIAKLIEKRNESVEAEAATAIKAETHDGLIIGTASYMSPEQARGKDIDARSDIFSFGVVLYEMMAGKQAFAGESAIDTISAIIHKDPVPLSQITPDIPRQLQHIVEKSLRKDREERYQTAKDLLIDLKDVRQDLQLQNQLERTAPPNNSNESKTQILSATTNDAAHTTSSAEYVVSEIKSHKSSFAIGLIVLLLASIGLGYWFFINRSSNTKGQIESIAVLPFVNQSGNADNDYLSDGITESLINSLSQLPKLAVKARSSVFRYKGKDIEPQTVGNELSVQAVLNGRVVQRGDSLTLSLELVDTKTGNQIWGEQYNRKFTDIVSLQNEIAREVSNKLRQKLSGADEQKLTKNYPVSSEAYEFYLQGLYHWNKRTNESVGKATEYFQRAIEKDPNYALAYIGLASSYIVMPILPPREANPKAKAAALKALEIDESLGEAHAVLANVSFYYEYNWENAEREYKRAIELSPNYPTLHHWYGDSLAFVGRFDESFAEYKRALELDPLSFAISTDLGLVYYRARQYDRSIEHLKKLRDLDPNYVRTHDYLAIVYEEKGMFEEALAEKEKSSMLQGKDMEKIIKVNSAIRNAIKESGAKGYWQKLLDVTKEQAQKGNTVYPIDMAIFYAKLNERDQAFVWLEKAFEERLSDMVMLKVSPEWDNIRSDPRFQDLLRRVGLPQ